MSCLSPWYHSQGEKAAVETFPPPVKKSYLGGGGVTRDVGSVMLRGVVFIDVTGRYSDFWGEVVNSMRIPLGLLGQVREGF